MPPPVSCVCRSVCRARGPAPGTKTLQKKPRSRRWFFNKTTKAKESSTSASAALTTHTDVAYETTPTYTRKSGSKSWVPAPGLQLQLGHTVPRPPNLGCHSTCKLCRACEHTAYGILGFAAGRRQRRSASASALWRRARRPRRRQRRRLRWCPAVAAVSGGRGGGGGGDGGGVDGGGACGRARRRRRQRWRLAGEVPPNSGLAALRGWPADIGEGAYLWYSLKYGRACKGAAGRRAARRRTARQST